MRRFAGLLAILLSAGAVSAQDPEDRVPIPAMIDTWYRMDQKIEEKTEPCGSAHETLTTTTMRNYRYEYFFESEYSYTLKEASGESNSHFIHESLKAQLEEDFDIFDMDYTQVASGVQMTVTLRTYQESGERVVKIDVRSEPPQSREFKFLTSETIHLYLTPMLYRLRQSGSLAQPTRLREKVLIPTLDDPISVSYSTGALTSKDILGKQVKVSEVRIEGWDRGALAPLSHIWVDKYGRIVEAESADKSMTLLMMKDEGSARGGRKGIVPGGRRDPFSKKDAMTPGDGSKGPRRTDPRDGGAKKVETVDIAKEKFDAVLAETQALIPKLQDEVAKGFPDEARRTYLTILMNYKGLYKHVELDIVKRPEVDKLREDAERIYGGVKKLLDVVAGKVDRINDLYLNDNIEGIDREILELKAMRQAPELYRSEDGVAQLEAAIRAAEVKKNQCLARIELGKKTLVLTGTITATEVVQEVVKLDVFISGSRLALSQPVSIRRVVTFAVVNDEPYREGDIVQQQGVKIIKIHRHAIEVEYKGEVRQVVLRK